MMQVDRELARRVAETIEAESQSAWRKALLALQADPAVEEGLYVEGWAVLLDSLLIIEHGWLEIEGQIVDPTRWDRHVAYFPALRFDRDQVLEVLVDCPDLPVTWRCGPRIWDSPTYHQAWQDAFALAQSNLAQRKGAV